MTAAPSTSPRRPDASGPAGRCGTLITLFVGSSIVCVYLSAKVASGRPILAAHWGLLWTLAVWSVAALAAVAVARRIPRRVALGLLLVAAAAVRLAALAGPPTTSDDLYRYAWDGRVQAAGIDPYSLPPAAQDLVGLREPWLWPDATGCAALDRGVGCTRINRPAVRTIYPPVAEAWFAAVYHVDGVGARHKVWQVAGLVTDLVTVGLLVVALRRWGADERWAALYALFPAPVIEFVQNAHVDSLALVFIVAAFVVAIGPSVRGSLPGRGPSPPSLRSVASRDVAVGLLLGAATLVKLYPAILLVAVLGLPRLRPWLSFLRASAAALVLGVLSYLPHVLAVGIHVIGYLPGYLKEEHYEGGGRFLLAGALGLSGRTSEIVAVTVVMASLVLVAWRRPPAPRAAVVVLCALFLTTTPVQPWYAVSLVAMACIAGWPEAIAVVAAGYPYFFAVILDYRHTIVLGRLSYGLALMVLVAGVIARRPRVLQDQVTVDTAHLMAPKHSS
jgi:hypothetical protein